MGMGRKDAITTAIEMRQLTLLKSINQMLDLHQLLKATVPLFVDSWLYQDLCHRLQRFYQDIEDGKKPRLILCLPPRHLKSETASVRFPLWLMSLMPNTEIICASYAESLSIKLSRRTREILTHPYYKKLFGCKLKAGNESVKSWQLDNGSTYYATSVGGAATGQGADVFIVDDPIKNLEEAMNAELQDKIYDWYRSVATTRLSPKGGVIIILTRWAENDLAGKLINAQRTDPEADKWELVSYPAIAVSDEEFRKAGEPLVAKRFDTESLLKIKANIGSDIFESLYQQNPTPSAGVIFKKDWFNFYDVPPETFDEVIQSWDLRFSKSQSKGSSWVVGQVWGRVGARKFLLDEVRGKWGYTETKTEFIKLSDKWPQAILKLVEKKASGEPLEEDLGQTISGIVLVEPRGDKIQRSYRTTPCAEAGDIWLPSVAPWINDWVNEICRFPKGADDDRVDAMNQAIERLLEAEGCQWECASF